MRKRTVHTVALLATLLLAGCGGISANSLPPSADSSSSTTSPARPPAPLGVYVGATDGTVTALDPTTGAVRWRYQFACACPAHVQAVANGLIYAVASLPANETSTTASLSALDASNGSVRWQLTTPGKGTFSAVQKGAAYITSVAPTDLPTQHNEIQARNAGNGALLWHTSLSGTGDLAATLAGATLYLTSFDSNRYYSFEHRWTALYALDVTNGSVRWQRSLGASDFILAVANGQIYVNEGVTDIVCGSTIHALNATDGTEHWAFPKETTGCASFIGTDRTLIYGITSTTISPPGQSTLYTLNSSDGSKAWQIDAPFPSGTALLANGAIYLPSRSGNVLAYSSGNGSLLWHAHGEGGQLWAVNGALYTSIYGQSFDALNPTTGAVRWRYQTNDMITLSTATHGIAYVVSSHPDATFVRHQSLIALDADDGKLLWSVRIGTTEDAPLIG